MKKIKRKIREIYIRFLIWIGYKAGLWTSIIDSQRALKEKNLASELRYLIEACYYTHLDREYLKVSVNNRIIASILLNLKESNDPSEVELLRTPEELKTQISKLLKIDIQETELGYRVNGQSYTFWSINCPKKQKRLLCLLAVCLDNNKSGLI